MCKKNSKKISIFSKISLILISLYQKTFSAVYGKNCRFCPTCSEYAIQAIIKYGFFYGWYLSIKRIIKCNPWGPSGFDPVPKYKKEKRKNTRD